MFARVLAVIMLAPAAAAADPPDFDSRVAPLLAAKCLGCHGAESPKGGLDLSGKKAAAAGGDSGAAILAGKPAESSIVTRTTAGEMPPKKPLSAADRKLLADWVAAGAKWGTDPIDPFAVTTADRGGRDWWSLRPLGKTPPPTTGHPIDAFIDAKLRDKNLAANPPADPRILVRRVYFDVIGLPPPVEVVDNFAKSPTPAAFAKLVDGLLASPQYGERWGRHWLDVVRYGESDGFERNAPRPNAWPYRNWVIRAINDDLPFDQFAKRQIAGDVLDPGGVAATGFLVAGVHNTVLGANAAANMTARQDELEDVIGVVGQAFLGLTVQCARCHDHKFDPVTQLDYYRLTAALGGVTHGERPALSASAAKLRGEKETGLRAAAVSAAAKIADIERTAASRIRGTPVTVLPVTPLARWAFDGTAADRGNLTFERKDGANIVGGRLILDGERGFAITAPLPADLTTKTLEVWAVVGTLNQSGGGVMTVETADGGVFDSLVFAEQSPNKWIAGSDNFRRSRVLAGPAETPGKLVHVATTYAADGRIQVYRDGVPYGDGYGSTPVTFRKGEARVLFGKRHTGGGRAFFRGEIEEARLYDRALTAAEIAASAKAGPGPAGVPLAEILAALTPAERAIRDEQLAVRTKADAELAALPGPTLAFAVVSAAAPPAFVLARGDVKLPKQPAPPGGVACVPGTADFGLPATATDADRRAKLAEWVARPDNPLFARVAVNRMWHYHFGIGIVDTPSDFGFNGGRPSHPELLDWLAGAFARGGFRPKAIHKLILTSAAYQRSASKNPGAAAIDADNRLLWRKTPARLDAEGVRDAILSAAGELNPAAGGPGFHDVRTYFNNGTTYYEPIDPAGPEFHRRTVYRFSPRGERSSLLETFDCPDPSSQAPRRQITTTPLQALAMWNGSFTLRMADALAARGKTVEGVYLRALARPPTAAERGRAEGVAAKHGLAAVARALLNCTEFVMIE